MLLLRRCTLVLLLLSAASSPASSAKRVSPHGRVSVQQAYGLRCEWRTEPLGVGTARPLLGWMVMDARRGAHSSAYQLLAASSLALVRRRRGDLWDSGRIPASEETTNGALGVTYGGIRLSAGDSVWWRVRLWDRDGSVGPWSAPAHFSVGPLSRGDWFGSWIGMPQRTSNAPMINPSGAARGECPWMRKSFALKTIPQTALATVGSIGYHELFVNGRKVGDAVLTPSVSHLGKRALYVTYDVRPYLQRGQNVMALWLAPGWAFFRDFNPPVSFGVKRAPLVIAQLRLGPARGPFTRVVTDESWRCMPSNTRHIGNWHNGDFGGDSVDMTRDNPQWNVNGLDDSGWPHAARYECGVALSPDLVEPNRRCSRIAAARVERVGPGKYRFTMAHLFTGWVEAHLHGPPGSRVVIHVSSLPNTEEEYHQRDEFTIGHAGEGTFCSRFSYHEVGAVTLEGLDSQPRLDAVAGFRVSNDRARIGEFDCSNRLLKRIYDITAYNYVNLSTGGMTVDCPHRERLGYGGDGHTSLELALDTFASAAFFRKWADDWCDIQQPDGMLYHTAPTMGGGGGPAWSGFVVVMPWEVYLAYGDRRILERTYPTARRWLEYLHTHENGDGLLQPLPGGPWYFLGDWAAPGRSEGSSTPEALLFNNCYYIYVMGLAAETANALGLPGDVRLYRERAVRTRAAVNRRFLDARTTTYLDTRETHCVMPLVAKLQGSAGSAAVLRNLEREILLTRQRHFDTGLHGTYFLTKYLTEHDRSDLLFACATTTTAPGYGDLIARGYETWPEYWTDATSRMHGCLNGIGGWFQRGLAGIRPDSAAPGYRHFIVQPAVVGDLTWVRAEHRSPYGRIAVSWRRSARRILLDVTVPPGSTATVYVPARHSSQVTESGAPAQRAKGVRLLRHTSKANVYVVESGSYHFAADFFPRRSSAFAARSTISAWNR